MRLHTRDILGAYLEDMKRARRLKEAAQHPILPAPPEENYAYPCREEAARSPKKESLDSIVEESDSPVPAPAAARKPRLRVVERAEPQVAYTPTYADLLAFYRSHGLVGEESLAIVQTLGAIDKMHFGIESISGSGKSFTMDIMVDHLLPPGSVYKMQLASNTAEFYNASSINECTHIYIPELQKAMKADRMLVTEILKNITDGKDAVRRKYDLKTGSVNEQVITTGKGVMFTLAIENDFKYDTEFSRRVFVLPTDVSEEQTQRIVQAHALRYQSGIESSPGKFASLKSHIRRCIDAPPMQYQNPFATYVAEQIPPIPRARSYGPYLFNMMNAAAKFSLEDHVRTDEGVILNLQDIYTVQQAYWPQFCKSLLGVPLLAEQVLGAIDKLGSAAATAKQVYEVLSSNRAINYETARHTLEQLATAKYLLKDDYHATNPRFTCADAIPEFQASFDWGECMRRGKEYVASTHPELYDEWMQRQGGVEIRLTHPTGGPGIIIRAEAANAV